MNDPRGSGGTTMPLRGGSWGITQRNARVAYRDVFEPGSDFGNVGFRVVVAPIL